ncbi:MAG TPA: hypothetical protein VII33_04735, partial [Nakamurella sp.]
MATVDRACDGAAARVSGAIPSGGTELQIGSTRSSAVMALAVRLMREQVLPESVGGYRDRRAGFRRA